MTDTKVKNGLTTRTINSQNREREEQSKTTSEFSACPPKYDNSQKESTQIIPMVYKRSSRGRTYDGQPNPVDIHVGNRMRLRRTLLGLSQEKLATIIGLTFQQVQKYERGMNRIGASRLWDISRALEIPIQFFYADMDKETAGQSPRMFSIPNANFTELPNPDLEEVNKDPMQRREAIELVKFFYQITDRQLAIHLFEAIKKIGSSCSLKINEIAAE